MPHASRLTPALLLAIALCALSPAGSQAAQSAPDPERTAIVALLEHAGLLADPFAGGAQPTELGALHVTHRLRAGAPAMTIDYGRADAAGRPAVATVTVERWLTGTLDIARADASGRERVVSKLVRDSCVRQVTLRRIATGDDPLAARWKLAGMSALVRLTPGGTASLPLVGLNTQAVSSGFLSVLSDVEELAVLPQTCAVTPAGAGVHVLVAGLSADDEVCVFAGGTRVTAVHRDDAHAEATIALEGPAGLREVGVTVFPRRTLAEAGTPADTRSWVLPILVGTPPPPTQEYFAL